MSLDPVTWAWERSCNGGPLAKLVLVCIASHTGADGIATVALDRLSANTQAEPWMVRDAIASLETQGLLDTASRSFSPDGSKTLSGIYRLRMPSEGRRP